MQTPERRPRPPAWRILVAGGGVPGLVFALASAQALRHAVAITICDPGFGRERRDGRAYALSGGAVAMLGGLGIWPELAGAAQPITGMTITDGRVEDPVRPAYLTFEGEPGRPLGHMVEAAALVPLLVEACRAAGVTLSTLGVRSFTSSRDTMTVELSDATESRFSLLVVADGARSRLREAAGIAWYGRRYGQSGIVATVAHSLDHVGRATQHFLPSGPFAILPLGGAGQVFPHRSSIVWTERDANVAAILALPPEAALAEVEARFGSGLGAIALETPLAAHPLSIGLARRYVASRLALLGDAAHEIHPLAGQGLNLGLADAAALAERIADAVRLGSDPGAPDVLGGYERDRRFDAVALAGATDALNRLFSNDRLTLRALRDLGLGLVDRVDAAKSLFAGQASGATARAPRLMRGEAL